MDTYTAKLIFTKINKLERFVHGMNVWTFKVNLVIAIVQLNKLPKIILLSV